METFSSVHLLVKRILLNIKGGPAIGIKTWRNLKNIVLSERKEIVDIRCWE
jgi:hypothetical protein